MWTSSHFQYIFVHRKFMSGIKRNKIKPIHIPIAVVTLCDKRLSKLTLNFIYGQNGLTQTAFFSSLLYKFAIFCVFFLRFLFNNHKNGWQSSNIIEHYSKSFVYRWIGEPFTFHIIPETKCSPTDKFIAWSNNATWPNLLETWMCLSIQFGNIQAESGARSFIKFNSISLFFILGSYLSHFNTVIFYRTFSISEQM